MFIKKLGRELRFESHCLGDSSMNGVCIGPALFGHRSSITTSVARHVMLQRIARRAAFVDEQSPLKTRCFEFGQHGRMSYDPSRLCQM